MKVINGKVVASAFEKLWVFGKENLGKPEIFDGKNVVVHHSIKWRLALLISVITAIFSQYSGGLIPWYISVGLLGVPFLVVVAFFCFSELYFDRNN